MAKTPLHARLTKFRGRLMLVGSLAGLVWSGSAAVVLLLFGAWLDLLWELPPEWRVAAWIIAAATAMTLTAGAVVLSRRAGRSTALARRLDGIAGSRGAILTGVDLDAATAGGPGLLTGLPEPLSVGLAQTAVAYAAGHAATVPVGRAAPLRPLLRSMTAGAMLLGAIGLLVAFMPGLALTEWNRFRHPFADVPPFSQTEFVVEPGDTEVLYGNPLDLNVIARGASVDQVELVLDGGLGRQEVLPMFSERGGRWRATLAKVTEPAAYYARAYRARSKTYQIGVITVPRIENVRLRIVPPEYANRPAYEGPLPKQGVTGLPHTRVRVWARSNRPLGGGTLAVGGTAAAGGKPSSAEHAMKPTGPGSLEVVGDFEVTADGKFRVSVTDVQGQSSRETFEGTITLLADTRPFIRIVQPRPTSLATPNAVLPVALSAEDDYGIARVQLFRSLNDSRPLPADATLPTPPPRRADDRVYLPLAEYGLEPGDVIKLFGRVEDNDPAGTKGAESGVASVRIISQEDFERLLRQRQGLEVLMSKYRAAERRMEQLAAEAEGLRKKLKDLPPKSPLAQETRREAERLLQRLRKESEEIRKSAKHLLPYDIDKKLSAPLGALAGVPDELAAELEKLLADSALDNEQMARQLEKLAQRLSQQRQQYAETAMVPLELLEAVFPLLADQAKFIELALRQRDLAERMAALRGHDAEDDPALKVRMRDLEQQQRQLRDDLNALLADVEDHAKRLPEKPELEKLRETALKFAEEVRGSGAAEAMAEAESALAQFAGTRAAAKSKEAADVLEKFISKCEGIGEGGMSCLVFQPNLGSCLGDSVEQLLADMGLSSGNGPGGGSGAGGGYSARRGAMRNMDLYGSLPGLGAAGGNEGYGSGPARDTPGQSAAIRGNPDSATPSDVPLVGSAAGTSEAAIPPRYRRQVGDYFQRIAEELKDQ